MPVVNDVPGAYEKIKGQADSIAAKWNVPKEILYGYFNETAHFPVSLGELREWGDKPTKYGVSRRDPATGAWHAIMPGTNPDPRLTPEDRGGFPHNITNAEDADIQRFQQVDPSGNVYGGSWNPQVNAAHPEWSGKTGMDTVGALGEGQPSAASPGAGAGAGSGGVTAPTGPGRFNDAMRRYLAMVGSSVPGATQTAQVQPMRGPRPGDEERQGLMTAGQSTGDYVAPVSPDNPNGMYVSVVGGVPNTFASRGEAEADFTQRGGGGTTAAPGAGSAGGVTAPAPGGGAGGASSSGGPSTPGVNLGERQLQINAAYNDAQLAYLREKMILIDKPLTDAQIEQMAMNAAHQAVADGLAQQKYQNIDLPMLKLQQDQLAEQKRQYEKTFGLQQGQLDLSRQQAATDATLRGTQIASQEATQRAQIGTSALQGAEQLGLGRQESARAGFQGAGQLAQAAQDAARTGFLGAEAAGAQRGSLAQSGFLGAEQQARAADEFVASGAKSLNDTALQAIQQSTANRGPRNAWVQQAANRGLNAAGLTSDVGAIAGEYDPAAFNAPRAAVQPGSLGTAAADILGAGGGAPGGGAPGGGLTPNQMLRQQITARMADPYGAGGRAALDQATGIASDYYGAGGRAAMDLATREAADPYGAAGRAMMDLGTGQVEDPYGYYGTQLGNAGADQLANQYTSPSSIAAMRTAWQNMPEAQANGPTAALRGSGARINAGYTQLRAQLGRNPTGQEVASMVSSMTGLPPDVADRIGQMGVDYFTSSGGQPIPDDVLEQRVVQAATSVGGLQQAPGAIGAPDRLDRAYWNLRRQTGTTPGYTDPMVQRMYREEGSPNPALSAWNAADYSAVDQYPMPFGPLVGNVTAPSVRLPVPADTPGWSYPPTGPSAADPFGRKSGPKMRFTDMVKPRALVGAF